MYNTSAKREKQPGEINSGECLVETAGYVSRERKIKSMIAAGERLEQLRKLGAFDIPPGQKLSMDDIEKIPVDPTRSKSFDFAAASQILRDLELKVREMKAELKDLKKPPVEVKDGEGELKASENAQDASGEALLDVLDKSTGKAKK